MAKKRTESTPETRASVSATEAARNFSELLNRVRYRRQTFLIERGGRAVCEIRPVYEAAGFTGADLARLLGSLPEAPAAYLDAVAEGIENQPAAEETRWPR
jgi:antitoxin (DNA-binding transcriptional repressor) of toxin-antitoxin stability system